MSEIPVFTLYGETTPFPDVVHCETFLARAPEHSWTITAHRHSNMAQFFGVTSGRVQAKIDGIEHILSDGAFTYLPAQTVHELEIEPQTDGMVVSFPQSLLNSVAPTSADLNQALSQFFSGTITPRLAQITDLLLQVTSGVDPFRQHVAVGLAHGMLGILAGLAPQNTGSHNNARISRLDALIAMHHCDGWGATDYAAKLCISTGHLSRLCRAAKGVGVSIYIERAAMEEACRMLAFTRMPVANIGYRLGYSDPSYFSRRFKRVRGQTPSDYRTQFVD